MIETTAPNYSVYLATEAAAAPAHGIFVVYTLRKPDPPHYTGKQPCGLKGEVKGGVDGNFTHHAPTVMAILNDPKASRYVIGKVWEYLIYRAESKAREENDPTQKAEHTADAGYLKKLDSSDFTLCIGRKFGDEFVGIDTDGFTRGPEWSNNTGYREISSSGTGGHIITRIPPELIPSEKNKLKRPFEGGDIEIFHGRGNGIAISGRDATAGPIDLDLDSDAGKAVMELLTNTVEGGGGGKQPPARVTTSRAEQEHPKHEIDTGELCPLARIGLRIVKDYAGEWEPGEHGIPGGLDAASEAMQSVMTRAARELARIGYPVYHVSYAAAIYEIFRATPVYEAYYAPGKGHDAHPVKIEKTLDKAMAAGREYYHKHGGK